MSHSDTQTQTEQPLGEEALAIMAKARRRAAISMLIMLVGFMAIALVVVYRLSAMGSADEGRYGAEAIALPQGASVISTQIGDGLVNVTYEIDGATAIAIFDGATGEQVGTIAVETE